jgi:hypothetical protein
MAAALKINQENIQSVLINNIGLSAYKKRIHGLTNKTVAKHLERSKILLRWLT